jgi:hypothetical protein
MSGAHETPVAHANSRRVTSPKRSDRAMPRRENRPLRRDDWYV